MEKQIIEGNKNEFYEGLRVLCIENPSGFTKAIRFPSNNNKIELANNTKGRYVVAFTNYSLRDFKNKTSEDILSELYAFLVSNINPLYGFEDFTIGGWYNDGKYYVDLGVAVNDLSVALDIAKRYGQKAVFDLKEMREIFV